jgi:RNA-directed DNA polymerase
VPPHKRLINARPGCGIAVGNLSSQFFANVYLNALDQFVKHTLKCRHYVRYVDDFVLLHHDPQQLLAWREEIEAFLAAQLQLTLKQNANNRLPLPQPLANGCDFLGYLIYPQHKVVRRRVIQHCREKLRAWARSAGFGSAVRDRFPWEGDFAQPAGRGSFSRSLSGVEGSQQIRALVASYWGHFGHASHWRLTERLLREFGWLRWLFLFRPGKPPIPRFACGTVDFFTDQIDFYRQMYPAASLRVQKGYAWVDVLPAKAKPLNSRCQWWRSTSAAGCATA